MDGEADVESFLHLLAPTTAPTAILAVTRSEQITIPAIAPPLSPSSDAIIDKRKGNLTVCGTVYLL